MILDASALLAFLLAEPGSNAVVDAIEGGASISILNLTEVATRLVVTLNNVDEARAIIKSVRIPIVQMDESIMMAAGAMAPLTRIAGLSLADRVCLATAKQYSVPAMTADRIWKRVEKDVGVAIELIR
jgi:PIN domain nuclease of toxin-antitoxin system